MEKCLMYLVLRQRHQGELPLVSGGMQVKMFSKLKKPVALVVPVALLATEIMISVVVGFRIMI